MCVFPSLWLESIDSPFFGDLHYSHLQDEVDDSRTTLGYAVAELKKDIQAQFDKLPEDKKADFPPTKLAIFVGALSGSFA